MCSPSPPLLLFESETELEPIHRSRPVRLVTVPSPPCWTPASGAAACAPNRGGEIAKAPRTSACDVQEASVADVVASCNDLYATAPEGPMVMRGRVDAAENSYKGKVAMAEGHGTEAHPPLPGQTCTATLGAATPGSPAAAPRLPVFRTYALDGEVSDAATAVVDGSCSPSRDKILSSSCSSPISRRPILDSADGVADSGSPARSRRWSSTCSSPTSRRAAWGIRGRNGRTCEAQSAAATPTGSRDAWRVEDSSDGQTRGRHRA